MLVLVGLSAVYAQLGNRPSGFDAHHSKVMQISFYYPGEWFVAEEEDNLAVVSREGLIDQLGNDQPDLQPGDVVMVMGVLPTMLMAMMGIPADDVETLVDGLFDNLVAEGGNTDNAQTELLTFGSRRVATVLFDDQETGYSGTVMVAHEQEEVISFSIALGFREDLDRHRDMLATVLSTVEFTGDFSALLQQGGR